jgi:hypothetical protein
LPEVLPAGVGEDPRTRLAGQSPCSDNTARCRGVATMNAKARIFSLYSHILRFVRFGHLHINISGYILYV